MSLLVWLPCNGNERNYGTGDQTVAPRTSGTTLEYDDFGKLGKALKTDPTTDKGFYIDNPFVGLNSWSLCFWVKDNGSGDWDDIFTFSGSLQRLEMHNSNLINYNQSTSAYGSYCTSGTTIATDYTTGKYFHIVLTYKNGTTKFYENNVLKVTQTGKTTFKAGEDKLYFGSRVTGGTAAKLSFNDIHCYDTCLSEKEIDTIYKCCAVHYNFSTNTAGSTKVYDSSGYGNTADVVVGDGAASYVSSKIGTQALKVVASDTKGHPCYLKGSMKNSISSSAINEGLTINYWLNLEVYGAQTSGIFSLSRTNSNPGDYTGSLLNQYDSKIRINYTDGKYASISPGISTSTWAMMTITIKEKVINYYINGKISNTTTVNSAEMPYSFQYIFLNWSNAGGVGRSGTQTIGDFKIYMSAFSAAEVLSMYQSMANIDNAYNLTAKLYNEDSEKTDYGILTTESTAAPDSHGVFHVESILEPEKTSNIKYSGSAIVSEYSYDNKIYIEPDGSTWIRIFHHNNPANAKFASSDSFSSGKVYKDADRWFAAGACSLLTSWEMMIKQKLTSSSSEVKYRWTQPANPFTCAYADIHGKVVHNTTSGYTNYTYGGLFRKNSNTYLASDNNTNGGNWFGAVGSWSTFDGGIPAYPNSGAVTSGYMDLYIRIPSTKLLDKFRTYDNGMIIANQFIED